MFTYLHVSMGEKSQSTHFAPQITFSNCNPLSPTFWHSLFSLPLSLHPTTQYPMPFAPSPQPTSLHRPRSWPQHFYSSLPLIIHCLWWLFCRDRLEEPITLWPFPKFWSGGEHVSQSLCLHRGPADQAALCLLLRSHSCSSQHVPSCHLRVTSIATMIPRLSPFAGSGSGESVLFWHLCLPLMFFHLCSHDSSTVFPNQGLSSQFPGSSELDLSVMFGIALWVSVLLFLVSSSL